MGFRTWLCLGSLLLAAAAQAQSLPAPREFYFDEDRYTTRPIVAVPGEGEEVVERLAARVQRRPEDVEASAQLAHVAMRSGRTELGHSLYQGAQRNAANNTRLQRAVTWNYAWDLYRAGEVQQALEQWRTLIGGWPKAPSWQPPTLALALWRLGRQREAVAWYAAAVRTEPTLWTDAANFPRLLPDWDEADRAVLAEVAAAWQANPPSWP